MVLLIDDSVTSTLGRLILRKICFLIIVLAFFSSFAFSVFAKETALEKVSLTVMRDIAPVAFVNDNGEPDGLFVRTLQEISKIYGFEIEYYINDWPQGLKKVKDGEIDLIGGAIKTPERETYLDYCEESVMTGWGTVCIRKDSDIENVFDLDGKTIAGMAKDQNLAYFKELAQKFNIKCTYVETKNHTEVIKLLEQGKADAGVVFSMFFFESETVKVSSMVFNPVNSYFVTAKGTNKEVLDIISKQLKEWKQDQSSKYYQVLSEFYGGVYLEKEIIPRWVQISFAIMFVLFAGVVGISILLKYLVNRKTKDLQESEARLRMILDEMPILMDALDENNHVIMWNRESERVTGYKAEEIVGNENVLELLYPDAEYRETMYSQLTEGNRNFRNRENRITCKDGTEKILSWSNISDRFPIPGWHAWGVAVDITELKQTEAELIKAKEKAEESDRLKTAFLAGISHEIRTPMNGIMGFANLLQDSDLSSDEKKEYIHIIEKSGKRMLNIINDLIDISKIEAGQINLFFKETNINKLLEDLFAFFKLEVEEKGLSFRYETGLSDNASMVLVDKERIAQVISNLLTNAIKFTDKGEIVFGYELKGDELEFFVRDTGIGIESEMQPVVFERFRQIDNTYARKYEGSGLGLSISKAFVEKHGGRMWLDSTEGEGSSFYFTLKYQKIETAINLPEEKESKDVLFTKKLKVLIVEDDLNSYYLLQKLLEKHDVEVVYAWDGRKALEQIEANDDIDIILMDIQMPVMDGLEATQVIKTKYPNIPIIAQTAFAQVDDKDKALKAGCDDFMTKPIDINLLFKTMSKYIDSAN